MKYTIPVLMSIYLFSSCQNANRCLENYEIINPEGNMVEICVSQFDEFINSIDGQILTPQSKEYISSIRIWNYKRHPLKPALVVKCANQSDVIKTINFVRDNHLLLSIKGGGHNSSGFSLNNNGVVLDLSQMDKIEVYPEDKAAIVGPGVRWGAFDNATQEFGLATTGAIISDVGVGGYTLGGGLGWLHRSLGSASDNLISAQVVTADGQVQEASANQNQDLFWAIRGGGGNFGVITSFKFQLYPVGPKLLAGLVFYKMEDVDKVIEFYNSYIEDIPDQLGTWLLFRNAPPIGSLPIEIHGKPIVAIAITYNGPIDEGLKLSAPLRNIVSPVADLVKTRPYLEWQSSLNGAWGNEYYNIWQGHYFMEINDDIVEILKEYVGKGSPYSDIKIQHLEGKFGEIPEDSTAFGNRNSKFGLVIQTRWAEESQTTTQEKWTADVFAKLKEHSTGKVYVNFIDNEGNDRVKDAYSNNSYERLKEIKRKYDPGNFFRKNQNIKP